MNCIVTTVGKKIQFLAEAAEVVEKHLLRSSSFISNSAFGAPISDYPRDAVLAAESLCTHGKDHPGLGGP